MAGSYTHPQTDAEIAERRKWVRKMVNQGYPDPDRPDAKSYGGWNPDGNLYCPSPGYFASHMAATPPDPTEIDWIAINREFATGITIMNRPPQKWPEYVSKGVLVGEPEALSHPLELNRRTT